MKNNIKQRKGSRGAALLETLMVMIFLSTMLFLSTEFGLVAYWQLVFDSAAQSDAHYQALAQANGITNYSLEQTLKQVFPSVITASVTPANKNDTVLTPNLGTTDFSVSDPSAPNGGLDGGFSALAPTPYAIRYKATNPLQLGLGLSTPIVATAIEATMSELCPHFCAVGWSQATSANYFTNGENTPPFLVGFNWMQTCLSAPSNGDLTGPDPILNSQNGITSFFNGCPTNGVGGPPEIVWRALGTAGFLDPTNLQYLGTGEHLDSSYRGTSQSPPAPLQAGPFFEVWCHRNVYVTIAEMIYAKTKQPSGASAGSPPSTLMNYAETYLTGSPNYSSPVALDGYTNNIHNGFLSNVFSTHTDLADAIYKKWDASSPQLTSATVQFTGVPQPWYGCGRTGSYP